MEKSTLGLGKTAKPYGRIVAAGFGVSAITTVIFHWIAPSGSLTPWIVLDFIMESFFVVGIYTVTRSTKTTLIVQFIIGVLLRTANAIKISYLGIPFLPADFFLYRDVLTILPWTLVVAYVCVVAVPVAACLVLVIRNWQRPRGLAWLGLVPLLAFATWIIGSPETYSDTFNVLLKNEMFGVPFLLKERNEALGVPLSFTIDLAKFLAVERLHPSFEKVHEIMNELGARTVPPQDIPSPPKRNVYILLTESFWNPTEMMPNFGADLLAPEFQSLWNSNGRHHMLSPMFGGGTANVEFEILCGIPARVINKGIVFQVALTDHVNCLPSLLRGMNYRTFAFHPFASGYYNRNVAFPLLGFDKFISIKDFKPDADPDSFVADDAFLHESVERARAMANGKPFLAYMMTFAGHWPYAWLPGLYEKKIVLEGKDQKPDLEILERHLNVNSISSEVLAHMTKEIIQSDPTALIVVAGDHLPGLAKDLYGIENGEEISDWHFYQTPLIVVDPLHPDLSDLPPEVSAYSVGGEILRRLQIPDANQAHFPWFQPPLLIRTVQNGATIVKSGAAAYQVCTPQSRTGDCPRAYDWLRRAHILGLDLVAGSQHSLSSEDRRPATADSK